MVKVDPFHTMSDFYGVEQKHVYHDHSDCGFGARLKRDRNDIPGVGMDRVLCRECARLSRSPEFARPAAG